MNAPDDDQVPAWFRQAIAETPGYGAADADGCRIAYRAWGAVGRRGLVLIHGGAAQAGWWDHIGPLLASEYRVAALDLSGHGDSDRRPAYSHPKWAGEVMAVAQAAGIDGPPVVVGHSMGGWVALTVAALHADHVVGAIAIDSPIRDRSPEEEAAAERRAFGPLKVYGTREQALARFRPIPEQRETLPFVMRHIAETSLKAIDGGWTWKFDPALFSHARPTPDLLTAITCRVAILRAEQGLITRDIGDHMYDLLGRVAPVIAIPEAGHHVMLDQPLSLVTALRALLADWEHSTPRRVPPE